MTLRDVINAKMVEIAKATAELDCLESLANAVGDDCEVMETHYI